MSEVQRRSGPAGRPFSRRALLRRGLVSTSTLTAAAVLSALTGCTPSDPRITAPSLPSSGRSTRAPSSSSSGTTTTATPKRADATTTSEQALADLAGAILTGPRRGELSAAQRRSLTAVREGHRHHVAALAGTDPGSRPSATPPGDLAKLSLEKSLSLLATREQQQAGRLRRAALAAEGRDALLRGSMMVAAIGYGRALRAGREVAAVSSAPPEPAAATVSDVAALQSVVRQLHALVYGYQVALGQLSQYSPAGRRALAALATRRRLRDRLERILLDRSADAPAAAGAYVPVVRPTTARRSSVLIRRMETAFEPFCGLWLASAARAEDRRLALDALADTTAAAQSWGAAVQPWPGA